MRDLGGQICKVEVIITIGEACVSLPLPSRSLPSTMPSFCLLWVYPFLLQARHQVRKQLVLADVMTRSHIQFLKQMFIQPHFTSTLSFSESRPCGNRLEQHKRRNIKNPAENLIALCAQEEGSGVGRAARREIRRAKFYGVFFLVYSKIILCWIQ